MIIRLIILLLLTTSTLLMGQAPLGFNYQGIAREADGTPISSSEIAIRVRIIDGPQGSTQFEEDHFLTTNEFGLFTAIIGQGNGNSTLNSVDWAGGNLWLQIELDPDNSGSYLLMGSQQLMSVPYALFAQQSGAGLTAGSGISINNGKINNTAPDRAITLTAGNDNIAIDSNYPNFTIRATGEDATNEIQDLQLSTNTLTITNNPSPTSIDLSGYLDNTDTQLTEAEVDAFVNNNGYLTTEVDGSTSNELQTISKTGNTVSLSNGGGSFTDAVDDADNDPDNEIQDLSSSASGTDRTINISGGTSTTISVADADNSTSNETITATSFEAGNIIRFVEGGVNRDLDISTLNANLNVNNNNLVNVSDPVNAQDAVNLQYLEAKDATDYAFKSIINETGTGSPRTFDISTFDFDEGNLISTTQVSITESGVYLFTIKGTSTSNANLVVNVNNATDYPVGLINLGKYYDTIFLKLTVGDIIELRATSTTNGELFALEFFGYKI